MTDQIVLGLIGLGTPAFAAAAAIVVAIIQFRGKKVQPAQASEPVKDLSDRLIDELTADRDDYKHRLALMTAERDHYKKLWEMTR